MRKAESVSLEADVSHDVADALAQPQLRALAPLVDRVHLGHCAEVKGKNPPVATSRRLTQPKLEQHVDPEQDIRYGVYPIAPGESTTRCALLDLDSHKGETPWPTMIEKAMAIEQAAFFEHGIQFHPFRSSGGKGLHLIALWDEPQDAYSVRQELIAVLAQVQWGVDDQGKPQFFKNGAKGVSRGEIEVFPKQDSVPADGWGNMFVLPFAGKSVALGLRSQRASSAAEVAANAGGATWVEIAPEDVRWSMSERVRKHEKPVRSVVVLEETSHARICEMLETIPNTELDYELYFKIMCAVHHGTGGSDDGLQVFETWASKHPANNPDENLRLWGPLGKKTEGLITVNTLKQLAEKNGYQDTSILANFQILPDLTADEKAEQARARARSACTVAARHATTDLKNAERLQKQFGRELMFARGQWHSWDGAHWAQLADDAFRKACSLSAIIHAEAKAVTDNLPEKASDEQLKAAEGVAKQLRKWAHDSENAHRIESAIKILRKFVTAGRELDEDPWLLNVRNGTVDLRTGQLRPHSRDDLITKIIDVDYDPTATAPNFESFLRDIMPDEATVEFLQRWFGYCATGDVSEQKFTVHWGEGGNGKSTLIEAIEGALGPYASRGTEDLMTGSSAVKEYTIAALAGGRMVTVSETAEGAPLRESTIKNVTGDAVLTGRFLYRDQFTFKATHKIQLLTNSKPVIKGQDRGIWRRVLLVPYRASYGSAEEVAAGKARKGGDPRLAAKLTAERAGILAWVVAGALAWKSKGLRPPAAVTAAVEDYQGEQDRIGDFLAERCELGKGFEARLMSPYNTMQRGLYPEYVSWAKDCGIGAVSRQRFLQMIEPKVMHYGKSKRRVTNGDGRREEVTVIAGLRLAGEES